VANWAQTPASRTLLPAARNNMTTITTKDGTTRNDDVNEDLLAFIKGK
jgi:hypothetical protein